MKYNYFYYGTAIARNRFLTNVPEDWENDLDEFRCYSFGGYDAIFVG